MNDSMNRNADYITRWLRILAYISLASILNSLISLVPVVPASVTTWVSRGITVAAMISMFQLAPVNRRYQKAGLFRALMLVCSLAAAFLYASSILTLAASVFSIIAVYQEYSAHSELIADKDTKLSGKWHSLFNWGIVAAVLISFGSIIAVLIVTMLQMDAVTITAVIVGVLSVPQLVIDIVYILYLRRMVALINGECEVYGHDL